MLHLKRISSLSEIPPFAKVRLQARNISCGCTLTYLLIFHLRTQCTVNSATWTLHIEIPHKSNKWQWGETSITVGGCFTQGYALELLNSVANRESRACKAVQGCYRHLDAPNISGPNHQLRFAGSAVRPSDMRKLLHLRGL